MESKREISTVLAHLMTVIRPRVLFRNDEGVLLSSLNGPVSSSTIQNPAITNYKRMLVAVDGCIPSIRTLDHASHIFQLDSIIYVLHIIEWPNDHEDNIEFDRVNKAG